VLTAASRCRCCCRAAEGAPLQEREELPSERALGVAHGAAGRGCALGDSGGTAAHAFDRSALGVRKQLIADVAQHVMAWTNVASTASGGATAAAGTSSGGSAGVAAAPTSASVDASVDATLTDAALLLLQRHAEDLPLVALWSVLVCAVALPPACLVSRRGFSLA
jgi:hypothetical protein